MIQQADAYEADLIIFNHEMTPRQSQLVGEAVGLPVIDRVQIDPRYFCDAGTLERRQAAGRTGTIRISFCHV